MSHASKDEGTPAAADQPRVRPPPPPLLRRQLSRVPVSALAFVDTRAGVLVLAGEGARLLAYRADAALAPDEPLWDLAVFGDHGRDQPVHGLRPLVRDGCARVLVWGAACVAIVDLDGVVDGGEARVLGVVTAPDWIYDGALSPWDPDRGALVTAHNDVIPLTCCGRGLELDSRTVSPSRPMLYSARLAWLSPSCILVAAGTVFGDVVVWNCHPAAAAAYTMLCRLPGHEGSVYGVDISPALALADGTTTRLIASCSDDRTIRVWDVSDAEMCPSTSTQPPAPAMETTGFRLPLSGGDGEPAGRVVAMVMGHLSRIWGVKFGLADPATLRDGALSLYSFGEDATVQRWRLSRRSATGGDGAWDCLAHERTMSLHTGKHLWAGTVLCRPGAATMIATGGADGKICLIRDAVPLVDPCPALGDRAVNVDVHDVFGSLHGRGEAVNRYDFLCADQLLVSTKLGRLFVGSLGDSVVWKEIEVDDDIAGYVRLAYIITAVGNEAAVLGTATGHIIYVPSHGRRPVHVLQVPGKIVGLSCLSPALGRDAMDASSVDIMVHLHGDASSHYITLDAPSGRVLSHEHTAGLEARFVATSAARMGGLLLLGSRHGRLSILNRQGDAWRHVLGLPPRSRDSITAIVPLPPKAGSGLPSPYFMSTSRDGKYRIHGIERQGDDVRCHLLHETSPPLGLMLEGAWFTGGAAPELILYGFKSKDFVIWNETRQEEVGMIDCGGGHPTFRLWLSASDCASYRFAFIRNCKLAVFSQAGPIFQTLKTGTHGREIRALSSNGRYVASGAEDTSIRIWSLESGERMRHLASIKAHVTGIQQLRWAGDEYLLSSGGGEEFLVWRVRQLDSSYRGLAVVCEAVFKDRRAATRDLRIMDFDVDVDGGSGLLLTLGFSNSTFRTYRYMRESGFEALGRGVYTGACVTQVRHVGFCRDRLWVATASTDGHLALWATGDDAGPGPGLPGADYGLMQVARLHQSSIKGLDMTRHEHGYLVMTGGDDNALGVAAIRLDGDGSGYAVVRRGIVRSAHAAAINGVAWVGGAVGVSVSNDQRIRAWRVKGTSVELLGCAASGVADAGDVTHVSQGRILVAGVGVEAWSLDETKRGLR